MWASLSITLQTKNLLQACDQEIIAKDVFYYQRIKQCLLLNVLVPEAVTMLQYQQSCSPDGLVEIWVRWEVSYIASIRLTCAGDLLHYQLLHIASPSIYKA